MTGRGSAHPPRPPQMDPSLESRPVPLTRQFTVRSYGPGADSDIKEKAVTFKELDALTGFLSKRRPPRPATRNHEDMKRYHEQVREVRLCDQVRKFFVMVQRKAHICWNDDPNSLDPTWGLCVFVTSYTEAALEKIDPALSTLITAVQRYFLRQTDSHSGPYALEIFKIFRLDLILNKDALDGASDDRVREEFNAHVRHLHLWNENNQERAHPKGLNRPSGPEPRFNFCLVLDEEAILKLSDIQFPSDIEKDQEVLGDMTVKIVDRNWEYPDEVNSEHEQRINGLKKYPTGVDQCPIWRIAPIYYYADSFEMEKMFPVASFSPGWY